MENDALHCQPQSVEQHLYRLGDIVKYFAMSHELLEIKSDIELESDIIPSPRGSFESDAFIQNFLFNTKIPMIEIMLSESY